MTPPAYQGQAGNGKAARSDAVTEGSEIFCASCSPARAVLAGHQERTDTAVALSEDPDPSVRAAALGPSPGSVSSARTGSCEP